MQPAAQVPIWLQEPEAVVFCSDAPCGTAAVVAAVVADLSVPGKIAPVVTVCDLQVLAGSRACWVPVDAPGASLWVWDGFIAPGLASQLLQRLIAVVPWRRDTLHMFGKTHAVPRLHQWFGDPGSVYRWSGLAMQPQPWLPALSEVRREICRVTKRSFNSVLVNYYRDGHDTVGWHADDEPELGPNPIIASVSLGAERDFVLRRNDDPSTRKTLRLGHGSLLVMAGTTQACWQHALPRRLRVTHPRVNLTFRQFG